MFKTLSTETSKMYKCFTPGNQAIEVAARDCATSGYGNPTAECVSQCLLLASASRHLLGLLL